MPNSLPPPARREPSWLVITVLLTVALAAATYYVLSGRPAPTEMVKLSEAVRTSPSPEGLAVPLAAKFTDEASMRAWLAQADQTGTASLGMAAVSPMSADYSSVGLDAPDRLKISGMRLFYATEAKAVGKRATATGSVHVVKAWPAAELNLTSSLDRTGSLLVVGDTLIVFDDGGLDAYNVTDERKPQALWHYAYGAGQALQTAEVIGKEVYVVIGAAIKRDQPCPLSPLKTETKAVTVPCDEIWHLTKPAVASQSMSVLVLDPATGLVRRSAGFIGASDSLKITLAAKGVYVTLIQPADELTQISGFLKANPDLVSATVSARLDRVRGYDLTAVARKAELEAALNDWSAAMTDDERVKTRLELARRLNDYWTAQRRETEQTVIMRLSPDDLAVQAMGTVPGRLTDRQALAASGDHLQVAVTVGSDNILNNRFGDGDLVPVSDVYVLDGSLKITGSLLDVSPGVAVIETRFLGSAAYVLTGSETDPSTFIDLSDPSHPVSRGSLKLSGYLSYLHPISATRLLAVSKEGSQAKISLLDVSAGAAPKELARYTLDDYWVDIQGTHQGFFLDPAHQVFFMPGSHGGYIMSYEGDQLSMITPVSGVRVTRAAAINDLLYLAGEDQMTVVSTSTWKRVMVVNWAGR
jgi:uncharacterized secreted protein with C-terminal beta-propeller domain